MNASILIPESMAEGLSIMVESDIRYFFSQARMGEYQKMGQLSKDELTGLQERVNILNELEAYWLSLKRTKPKTK